VYATRDIAAASTARRSSILSGLATQVTLGLSASTGTSTHQGSAACKDMNEGAPKLLCSLHTEVWLHTKALRSSCHGCTILAGEINAFRGDGQHTFSQFMPAMLCALDGNCSGSVHHGQPYNWSLHDYGDLLQNRACDSTGKQCYDYPSAQHYLCEIAYRTVNGFCQAHPTQTKSGRPHLWFTDQGPLLSINGVAHLAGNFPGQIAAARQYQTLAHHSQRNASNSPSMRCSATPAGSTPGSCCRLTPLTRSSSSHRLPANRPRDSAQPIVS
jgi:hypothetical protein